MNLHELTWTYMNPSENEVRWTSNILQAIQFCKSLPHEGRDLLHFRGSMLAWGDEWFDQNMWVWGKILCTKIAGLPLNMENGEYMKIWYNGSWSIPIFLGIGFP